MLNRVEKGIARWPLARLTTVGAADRALGARGGPHRGRPDPRCTAGAHDRRARGARRDGRSRHGAGAGTDAVPPPGGLPARRRGADRRTGVVRRSVAGSTIRVRTTRPPRPARRCGDQLVDGLGAGPVVPTDQLGQRVRAAGARSRVRGAGRTSSATAPRRRGCSSTTTARGRGWSASTASAPARPVADMITFRAQHLHHELGWNVAAIVLPVHGSRRAVARRRRGLPGLRHDELRARAVAVGVGRASAAQLGARPRTRRRWCCTACRSAGYVASLTSCFDGDLDAVIAGIPVCDFPALFAQPGAATRAGPCDRAPHPGGQRRGGAPGGVAVGDAVPGAARAAVRSSPGSAIAWRCPPRPRRCGSTGTSRAIRWFPGNHVGYLWSSKVADFVDGVLADTLAPGPTPTLSRPARCRHGSDAADAADVAERGGAGRVGLSRRAIPVGLDDRGRPDRRPARRRRDGRRHAVVRPRCGLVLVLDD